MKIVISLGGSTIVPDEIDIEFLENSQNSQENCTKNTR